MGVTIADFHGAAAPGKVGQDFFDEVGEALGECFEAMQIRKPGALGKVLVRALVDKDGTTKAVALTEDTIGEPKFAACVVEEVEGMTLPAADAGTAVFEVESLRLGPGMSLTGTSID